MQLLFKAARLVNERAIGEVRRRTKQPLRVGHTTLFPHVDVDGTRLTDLAARLGVSKQAVVQRATREGWKQRATEIERKAREASDKKAVETLESMNARHLKIAQAMQSKALAALQSVSLASGMDAMRALDMAVKLERLARGEPSDRTVVELEETIRREYSRWLTVPAKERERQSHDEHDG